MSQGKPSAIDRRQFVGLSSIGSTATRKPPPPPSRLSPTGREALDDDAWPVIRHYDQRHIARIALPIGGIGTGTVSLHGNGSLRDWEIMNRPAKGFTPTSERVEPFFAIRMANSETTSTRLLEGPLPDADYEASHGSDAPNANLPRFPECEFAGGYPFGRVILNDPELPASIHLKAFNPLIPADPNTSGIPIAVLTFEVRNRSSEQLTGAIAGSMPNFIGVNVWNSPRNRRGNYSPVGARDNRNAFRNSAGARGIVFSSEGVARDSESWGTMALATPAPEVTYRTAWPEGRWGNGMLDFWDDFSDDGRLEQREGGASPMPFASLAVPFRAAPGESAEVTFLLAWHFPNRYGWNLAPEEQTPETRVGNYYCTQYADAWDVVEKTAPRLDTLRRQSAEFVNAVRHSDLPEVVKEAALFNASTLRTQTCFRTEDGLFFGWEGCADEKGCCQGSCTHVWNYEQTTAHLFGSLAMLQREVEFEHATDDEGVMAFRVQLPLSRARERQVVAADGQMGCIMKMYRDWQLSGDDARLRTLWPRVRKALEFCWIAGGWDGDQDGVMEGVQHNTMDVEYYGPNPQMGFWYLGALRAAEEMARHLGEDDFAARCRRLFDNGSRWIDSNLFNGEYYEHEIRPVADRSQIPDYFLVGMGARDLGSPDYQLGSGCLVDQLVGQFVAHVCGLGYLGRRENIAKTHEAILKYNRREELYGHFNPMRTFALEGESALLMADYPKDRPAKPFPYFGEVMTGFEYTAAISMLYEGMQDEGLQSMADVRARYDGRKRSPYDEAECGHHYARAMAAWAAILALTGFHYSAVEKSMTFAAKPGRHFWSTGYAWGSCTIERNGGGATAWLEVVDGTVKLKRFRLSDVGEWNFNEDQTVTAGTELMIRVS